MTAQHTLLDHLLDRRRWLPAQRIAESPADHGGQIIELDVITGPAEDVWFGHINGRRVEKLRLALGRTDVGKGGVVLNALGFQLTAVPGQPVECDCRPLLGQRSPHHLGEHALTRPMPCQ